MKLHLQPTRTTPEVVFNLEEGEIKLTGRSSPDNSRIFYSPIIDALQSNEIGPSKLNIDIALEYFNTSTSKCLYDVFKILKGMKGNGTKVNINWHYDSTDDDMLETGEDYSDLLKLKFNFIEYTL